MSVVGFADLKGQVIGTLRVVQREAGVPVRHRCVCIRCGVSQVQRHDALMTGFPRCASNSNCGKKSQTADEWFANAKKQERSLAAERAREQQAEIDRKARVQQEQAARADAVAARRKQAADAVAAKQAQQKARWEQDFVRAERQDLFLKYGLSDNEIREVMNHESVTAEDFDDPEQNHFHFLAMQVTNQRAKR